METANAKALIAAIFKKDIYPLRPDPLKFAMEAGLHHVSPEVFECFRDSQHPPGFVPQGNKPAGRKRKRRPKVRSGVAWKWTEV